MSLATATPISPFHFRFRSHERLSKTKGSECVWRVYLAFCGRDVKRYQNTRSRFAIYYVVSSSRKIYLDIPFGFILYYFLFLCSCTCRSAVAHVSDLLLGLTTTPYEIRLVLSVVNRTKREREKINKKNDIFICNLFWFGQALLSRSRFIGSQNNTTQNTHTH